MLALVAKMDIESITFDLAKKYLGPLQFTLKSTTFQRFPFLESGKSRS
jgi:hypothetical protein